jgi:GAF domain-containing protein
MGGVRVVPNGLGAWAAGVLSTAGKVLGAFAIYFDEPRAPTTCEQSLIEQFTRIASIAVERAQNDAALKRSEAFLAEANTSVQPAAFRTVWRPTKSHGRRTLSHF